MEVQQTVNMAVHILKKLEWNELYKLKKAQMERAILMLYLL